MAFTDQPVKPFVGSVKLVMPGTSASSNTLLWPVIEVRISSVRLMKV
ncbi:hypothetical protein [Escherichia coli ISC41]|nr:hypothetical protein HMPREF1600_04221 [Escherichia coli 907715]CDL51021.1 hypothetical protein [Escherichia coli ISC41]